ncbi:uncharacterized protein METZ01_LOCUS30082 [marine metagenome]|uniref:Uncharacterized protein n=1 Tax=marine metagenome TaxID=408172 RepID=A0A381QE24_9ZZZZ|nr:TRAP transporter substrate-binding protein DctP [Acidobacteriota bacterium]|tara:strand:- start:211 stop:1191 length:981 start_codon:yes stop_codon:yes gene_type:complete
MVYIGILRLLLILALSGSACAHSSEDVRVLKLAHGLAVDHPVHHAITYMADEVSRLSSGTLRIDIYPSEQLGSEREILELVQLGIIAMAKSSSAPIESFVPAMQVFGLPYLFRDANHLWNVLEGPVGEEILEAGVTRGLKGLCYYDAGARSFYTTTKPIHQPSDLKGLKIRVQKSVMAMETVKALGGSPTPIDWGELYSALDQGIVDGAENNSPSFFVSRHYEISRYYSLDEHARPPDVLVINPAIWKSLSADHRQVLDQAVSASVEFQRNLWAEREAENLASIEAAGVTVIRPDQQAFINAVQPLWATYEGSAIGMLVNRVRAVQ